MVEIATLIAEVLKYVLPAVVVLIGMRMVIESTLKRQEKKDWFEIRQQTEVEIIPMRLQAYERAILFLERISPENLLTRIEGASIPAKAMQRELISQVKSEYEHNLAQQLYISPEAWMSLKFAKDQVIVMINQTAMNIPDNATGLDLSRSILQIIMNEEMDITQKAILAVKTDLQRSFRMIK